MAKKALIALLLFFSLFFTTTISYAQTADPVPSGDSRSANFWGAKSDAEGAQSYRNAIDDDGCMTPSLECLVHQVFRFTALEFVNSSLYTEFKPTVTSANPDGSTPVATGGTGVLHGVGALIGQMYSHPAADTQTYIADILDSAHITPKVYAQGLGFSSLNPILELWKAFRNIAYMFFVVMFIVIGFLIMFRQRVGGQAAITAQQAIPSIIVSLILVTFSYAIAGFLIDMMYVVMFLIIGIFGQTLPTGSENLIDMTILQVIGAMFKSAANPAANADLVSNLFGSLIENEGVNSFLSVAGGLTLSLVLAVAILIGTIKLFFELLKSYASVVLSVVTSPLVLMMGAIPGKSPIVPWIKDLIGNLLPFPVVLLVLVIFYQFSNLTGAGNEGGFIPPFLIARGQSGAIASLIGLALILALPEIVKDSKKGLVKEGFGSMVFKAASESVKQGWKGGELIPGVAASNTANIPVIGSGKDFVRKSAIGAAAATGAVGGGIFNKVTQRGGSFRQGFGDRGTKSALWLASKLKDPHIKPKTPPTPPAKP